MFLMAALLLASPQVPDENIDYITKMIRNTCQPYLESTDPNPEIMDYITTKDQDDINTTLVVCLAYSLGNEKVLLDDVRDATRTRNASRTRTTRSGHR
jgi:hypothetical protein